MLTDRQSHKQTLLKTISPCLHARVEMTDSRSVTLLWQLCINLIAAAYNRHLQFFFLIIYTKYIAIDGALESVKALYT